MIEKTIYDYLRNEIDVPVFLEVPEKAPSVMVVIEKTGSNLIDNHLYEAVIAVQSYEETLYKTASLNTIIVDKMLNLVSIDKICSCELNSDYNYPDVERNLYRYQAVFNITYLK